MGRRALPKIDPTLDLSRHLFLLGETVPPFDSERFLGRARPLQVEIGSGKGLFLETASRRVPEQNFVGVELGAKYARFAAARLAKQGRLNACVICGDGLRFFREFLLPDSLAAVHVYFPDPWWKKRHHKRRVMTAGLIADIERVLATGGTLHFWTDVQDYFQATLELLADASRLSGPHAVDESVPEHALDYRTHFERRTRLSGAPVYRAEFRKCEPAKIAETARQHA